ncbi:uncharacterized protein LOC121374656 [Gigantopelta aegis]|uniref:uncharacterized protein LOC121374656 n=1 Tax=Gigantopelta aegis TaxID=1735272 RepID=UPI001B887BDD|nr:uncharacterized protein LOC121374656 [Gigantopelta aegis]
MLHMTEDSLLSDSQCETVNDCLILLRNIFEKSSDQSTLLRRVFQTKLQTLLFALATHKQKDRWSIVIAELVSFFFANHTDILLEKTAKSYELLCFFNRDVALLALENAMKKKMILNDSGYSSAEQDKNKMISTESTYSSVEQDKNKKIILTDSTYRNTEQHENKIMIFADSTYRNAEQDKNKMWMSGHQLGYEECKQTTLPYNNYFSTDGSSTCSNTSHIDEQSRRNDSFELDANSSLDDAAILEKCLMEFAVEFIQTAFCDVVGSLIKMILSSTPVSINVCNMCSMISFFLNLAKKTKMEPGNIECFLNKDVIGYLINEAAQNSMRLSMLKRQMTICLATEKKLQVTVCALSQVFDLFIRLNGKETNEKYLDNVAKHLLLMNGLPDVFLILLSNFDDKMQSRFYLQNIIQANHRFLLLLESWNNKGFMTGFDMLVHVKQFFTCGVMLKYGLVLESFETNSPFLNTCILTMMHHAAGYCSRTRILQQLPILKTFLSMKEKRMPFADEFRGFMDYVMDQFLAQAEQNPLVCAQMLAGVDTEKTGHLYSASRTVEEYDHCASDQNVQRDICVNHMELNTVSSLYKGTKHLYNNTT